MICSKTKPIVDEINTLSKKIDEIYFMPDMPGYKKVKEDFYTYSQQSVSSSILSEDE